MTIEIADRLIKLRKKNGYSQEEVADKLGLSRQAVSKWERAEASPDTDNLICLAKLYNISLDELLSTDQDIDTIVKEQVKKEEPKAEGIHIVDDEGNEVRVGKGGIYCKDHKGHEYHRKHIVEDKGMRIINIVEGCLFVLATVAYVILGAILGMWWNAWVVFFIPEILCSIARAIYRKNPNKVNITFMAIFAFFFVCMIIPGTKANLWHPMWVVFLSIPVYHSIFGSINKIIGKEEDEDKDDDDEDDDDEKDN